MRLLILIFSLALLPALTEASDLLSVYRDALQNAPSLKANEATMKAADAGVGIDVSGYLPQLVLSADAASNRLNSPTLGTSRYGVSNYSLTLTQPIFDLNQLGLIANANHTAKAADYTYHAEQESFMISVASDYFAVLNAEQNVNFAQAQVGALDALLDQTAQKFKVGLATYIDLSQAKANDDTAKATLIKNKNALSIAKENLFELTSKDEGTLADLGAAFPFTPPLPAKADDWIALALKNNPSLVSQHYVTRSAYDNVVAAAGNQLPVVSLSASRSVYSYGASTPAFVSSYLSPTTTIVSLNLTWTVFSGGENFATTLQQAKQYEAAEDLFDNTYRTTTSKTRQDFLSVFTNLKSIDAYRQSVIASASSLEQYQAKYKVGTATVVDVLNQIQTLYQAKSNLSNAEYNYITSLLTLKSDAGTLSEKDLSALNQYLQLPDVHALPVKS